MRARTRLILDIAIACGLIAAYRPSWTGITLHEWVSLAIIVPLAVHLIVNWEWVVRIARTFLDRLFSASRANFVVDAGLLVSSVAVMLSGIMVSPIPSFFGIQASQLLVWATLHAWSANAIILLFAVHAVLHRRWIVATAKRLYTEPAAARGPQRTRQRPATTAVPVMATSGGATLAQTRRAARRAAEKATARRNASVLGVAGVTLALGSMIFASVAVAGPALSKSLAGQATATASVATTQSATSAHAASTARSTAASKKAKKKISTVKAKTTTAKAASTKAKTTVLVCPRTGCTASSCHATHGESAAVYYKTH
jgi:hypothetical protein